MKNRAVSFLIALLCAIGLWAYVVTVVNPEDTTVISNIPVTFYGEEELQQDRSLIITEGADTMVSVEVTGKRADLKKLSPETVSAVVDISRIRSAGEYDLSFEVRFAAELGSMEVNVTGRTPYRVPFTLAKMATKTIEVKGVFNGKVAEGYIAETMSYDHETITIQGPEELVQQVSYAQVILDRTNLDKTVTAELEYTLIDDNGEKVDGSEISCDVKTVKVTLPVVVYKEIPLSVEFIDGGGATTEDVIYTISPPTVTISGAESILDGVSKITLGNIDLADIGSSAEFTFPILIPNETKNVSGDETATVNVKIRGVETKTLRVTTIEFINRPKGCEAVSMTQQLQVLVRAKSTDIEKIAANNLRAVADLSEITAPGTYTVPVTVYVDGYENAGAVGEYTVVALITQEE